MNADTIKYHPINLNTEKKIGRQVDYFYKNVMLILEIKISHKKSFYVPQIILVHSQFPSITGQ